jgi:hypothetical protein
MDKPLFFRLTRTADAGFPRAVDIGPRAPHSSCKAHIREQRHPDQDALVLVAFGGIRLTLV